MNLHQAAGYKFRWHKWKVVKEGCHCSRCSELIPIGDYAYVFYNRWNRVISLIDCLKCHKTREGVS